MIPNLSPSKSLLLEIDTRFRRLLILVFYRLPYDSGTQLILDLFKTVWRMADCQETSLIICGDLNMASIGWGHGTKKLSDSVTELNLTQHIHEATHEKGNILEVVFTNMHCIKSIHIHKPFLSDHSVKH